jgi:hypothetical protein
VFLFRVNYGAYATAIAAWSQSHKRLMEDTVRAAVFRLGHTLMEHGVPAKPTNAFVFTFAWSLTQCMERVERWDRRIRKDACRCSSHEPTNGTGVHADAGMSRI